MIRFSALVISACILAACSGNPFDRSEDTAAPPAAPAPPSEPVPPGDDEDGIEGRGLPPGTTNPTPDNSIIRREAPGATGSANEGDGYARNFRYSGTEDDTFYVEGLAFDGDQPDGTEYARAIYPAGSLDAGDAIRLGNEFGAYEGPSTVPDFLTGTDVEQLQHRAVYGESSSGNARLAIVRTGSYINYGFGGFIYQRDGAVTLPTQGQATYGGGYAGLRDFDGQGGLEYVVGDMQVDIDFNGFAGNCSPAACANAVKGRVTNRLVMDMDGNNITAVLAEAISTGSSTLPTLNFTIGTGVMDRNGELTGGITSSANGRIFEEGRYYAVMSGDHTSGSGGEIVGIVVVEGQDPRATTGSVTFRETGGFIVERR